MLEALLGIVDQLEVDAERTDHRSQGVGRELADEFLQPCQTHRIRIAAQLQKAFAQPFHGAQHLAAGLAADYVAKQLAEQFDTAAQGLVVFYAGIDEGITHGSVLSSGVVRHTTQGRRGIGILSPLYSVFAG